MRTAIYISDGLFRSAEELAARLGISRSALYSKALAALVEKHRDELITSRLNKVYGPVRKSSSLDARVRSLQHRTLARCTR